MELEKLVGVVEALIFVSGDPVPLQRLCDVLELTKEEVKTGIEALAKRYDETDSAIQVMEVAGGFQLRTRPLHSDYVNRYLERKKKQTLSSAALEALAIIAYKQPVTRAEMEAIRGVGVDGVLKSLLDKRLVKVAGVKEVPGRPNLYGTTKTFLEYFGLNSIKDLPPVENISDTFASQAGATSDDPQESAQEPVAEESQPAETNGETNEPAEPNEPAESKQSAE